MPPPQIDLDSSRLAWHMDRMWAWERGERIAPVTMDIAITTACQYRCEFCAATYQTGERASIPEDRVMALLEDAAEIGVRGLVFMSDGENTIHPAFIRAVRKASELGLSVGCATNGYLMDTVLAELVLPHLVYLRLNVSAGEPGRYSQIMGVPEEFFQVVMRNIAGMVALKKVLRLPVTIGIQMVLMPRNADQVLPFAHLGKDVGVDYAIIKHCLDYPEQGGFGINYADYACIAPLIQEAEALSSSDFLVTAKWSKMTAQPRSYKRCLGPPFLLQVSGTGLVAACGPYFGPQFAGGFHIGNVCQTRLKDLWQSNRYWEVMDSLGSASFDARRCPPGCVQHNTNVLLDSYCKGETVLKEQVGRTPEHNFL